MIRTYQNLALVFLISLSGLLDLAGQEPGKGGARIRPRQRSANPVQLEKAFVASKPTIGDTIPEIALFDESGNPFNTRSFRGKYVVVTFGCLT